jgi:hypothetical protein
LSPVLGIILGVVAIALGYQAKKEGRHHGETAFRLGIAAVIIGPIVFVIVLWAATEYNLL